MRVLLLSKNDLDVIINFDEIQIEGVQINQDYLFRNDIPQMFVRVLRRMGYNMTSLTLGKWKQERKYDAIIVFESTVTENALEYISKKYVTSKKILCFRNAVSDINKKYINIARNLGYRIFTYNLLDSAEYDLEYNPQCWNRRLINGKNNINIEQDLYFLGRAKKRYEKIIDLKEKAEKQGLSTKFYIISNQGEKYTQNKGISYTECIKDILESRAIVDIVGNGNVGLTIRPLEALFCEKKLVTNYSDIYKYDFYEANKKNIFILGKDNIENLKEFVRTPFVKSEFDMDTYDIVAWIKRFLEKADKNEA